MIAATDPATDPATQPATDCTTDCATDPATNPATQPSSYPVDLFMPPASAGSLAAVATVPATEAATEPAAAEPENAPAESAEPPKLAAAVEPAPREWVLEPGEFSQLPDRAVQELWFELRTWSWKSLAIVPTVEGASELDVAEKLVVVGVSNTNRRMSLISAEGVTIGETDRLIAMIRAAEARGDRVLVATDSLQDNPAAAPIIRAVNGAILSVRMGVSDKAMVERTIATINRNRIIGVVTRTV